MNCVVMLGQLKEFGYFALKRSTQLPWHNIPCGKSKNMLIKSDVRRCNMGTTWTHCIYITLCVKVERDHHHMDCAGTVRKLFSKNVVIFKHFSNQPNSNTPPVTMLTMAHVISVWDYVAIERVANWIPLEAIHCWNVREGKNRSITVIEKILIRQ